MSADSIDAPIHVEIVVGKGPGVSVDEFIAAVTDAAAGLDSPYVDAYEFFESTRVAVCGWRQRTEEEREEYERNGRVIWLAAKSTYERGLSKYGGAS